MPYLLIVRRTLITVIALVAIVSTAHAEIIVLLDDEFDDTGLVRDASDQEVVKSFRKELDKLGQRLLNKVEQEIEKLLGKPAAKPGKTYAMPVAQPRGLALSGIRYGNEKLNKDHCEFYPLEGFAGVEVWYGIDGKSPVAVLVYLKVDKSFPKLTEKNLKERLGWDRERFARLVRTIEEPHRKK